MWHYGHLNGCDINVDFPKASYAHWVSGLSLLNHGPYITYKTRQRSQNSAETGTRQSMHFYWLHPSHLNRCRMGSKGRCHHGFEIILHFQPSRGSTATYLHIPPPKVLNLSHFKCPVCLQKGQTSLMNGNLSTQELIESALWTHSLPLTALSSSLPIWKHSAVFITSILSWGMGIHTSAGQVPGGCQFWGPCACTSYSLVFLCSSTPNFVCWLSLSLGLNWPYIQLYHNSTSSI